MMTFVFRDVGDVSSVAGTSLLGHDFEFPRLVIKRSALDHNIAAMAEFCTARRVSLAPHAKTTMAPNILRRQMSGGAWAMTVATMYQLRLCLEWGIPRVLVANELVNARAAQWLGAELAARDGAVEVFCLVDSPAGVENLSNGLRASGLTKPFPVLVEFGPAGGRAGCRTVDEAVAVAGCVLDSPFLELAGVEGFEGILGATRVPENLARVDRFLQAMQTLARRLQTENLFRPTGEVVLTAGGSTYFDRVAAVLSATGLDRPTRVVLRSGCYVTHDHRDYGGPGPLTGRAEQPGFTPALELWSEVLSAPEPDRAIAGFGRRDAPFDAGLPVVLSRVPVGEPRPPVEVVGSVTELNDQHAYIDTSKAPEVRVGDRLICGIRHPCTAFDKWRRVLMVDDNYTVVEVIETFF
jgi:D-serine dehydratase